MPQQRGLHFTASGSGDALLAVWSGQTLAQGRLAVLIGRAVVEVRAAQRRQKTSIACAHFAGDAAELGASVVLTSRSGGAVLVADRSFANLACSTANVSAEHVARAALIGCAAHFARFAANVTANPGACAARCGVGAGIGSAIRQTPLGSVIR